MSEAERTEWKQKLVDAPADKSSGAAAQTQPAAAPKQSALCYASVLDELLPPGPHGPEGDAVPMSDAEVLAAKPEHEHAAPRGPPLPQAALDGVNERAHEMAVGQQRTTEMATEAAAAPQSLLDALAPV